MKISLNITVECIEKCWFAKVTSDNPTLEPYTTKVSGKDVFDVLETVNTIVQVEITAGQDNLLINW